MKRSPAGGLKDLLTETLQQSLLSFNQLVEVIQNLKNKVDSVPLQRDLRSEKVLNVEVAHVEKHTNVQNI